MPRRSEHSPTSPNPRVSRLWEEIRQKLAQRRASQQPPLKPEPLGQIRRRRRVSQVELAARIGTSQGDLSRLERRPDLLVSTLARYLEALGGSLELWVRFPGLLVRIDLPRQAPSARAVTAVATGEERSPETFGLT
jgi:DNA-binding transcriptional regulator YiaG